MSNDQWLAYRTSGLGASEISTILGLNPYKSSIELFYDKIGINPRYNYENIAMFMGKFHEHSVGVLWQYWEGSEESVIANYSAGKIIRKCQRVNAYVRNPKFPHIFVSLDRKINKHGNKGEGALEIKTISGYESRKWESGIPPSHIIQLQTQIMVCEFDYGELAVQTDGRAFSVFPFVTMPEVQETIANKVANFWEAVLSARKLVNAKVEAERNFNLKLAGELQAEIEVFEPAPDGSEAYKNYLKEKYKNPTTSEKLGGIQELEVARKAKKVKEQIKDLKKEQTLSENILKKALGDVQALDFGTNGRVSWKSDINGTRRFINNVKFENE